MCVGRASTSCVLVGHQIAVCVGRALNSYVFGRASNRYVCW